MLDIMQPSPHLDPRSHPFATSNQRGAGRVHGHPTVVEPPEEAGLQTHTAVNTCLRLGPSALRKQSGATGMLSEPVRQEGLRNLFHSMPDS